MKYTVQSGDTLSKISQKYYGNAFLYDRILDANPQITDEDVISVGQVLEIPDVGTQAPSPAPTAPAPTTPSITRGSNEEKPSMTKAALVIFAVAAAALGYLVMKNMTKKGAPLAAANPLNRRRKRKNSRKKPEDFSEFEVDEEVELEE